MTDSAEKNGDNCANEPRVLTLSTHFMDELGLPEEHRVPLILRCFFLRQRKYLNVNSTE